MLIVLASMLVGAGTTAYFWDTETSSGNTFTAGKLDLKVNAKDDPIGVLVDLDDMKPCDWKYVTITLHVMDNPAKCWIKFTAVVSSEGTDTEPELADPNNGVREIEDYITVDVKIDDTVIINPAEDKKLGSLEDVVIDLGTLNACVDYTLELSFHLQEDVENWAQGDICTFSIVFGADQV